MKKAAEKVKEYIKGISSEYKEDAAIDYIAGYAQAATDLSTENTQLKEVLKEISEDLQEAIELFESAYCSYIKDDYEALYNTLANATSRTRFKQTINQSKQLLNKK